MTPFLNLAPHMSALSASLSMEVMAVSTDELQGLFVEALDEADCRVLHRISAGCLYVHPFAAMAVHSSWLTRVGDLLCVDVVDEEGSFLGPHCELSEAALADLMRACAVALMKASDDMKRVTGAGLVDAVRLSSTSGEPLAQSQVRLAHMQRGLRLVSAA